MVISKKILNHQRKKTGLNQYNKRTWLLLEFCQHGDMKTYLVKNKAKILDTSNEDVFN